MSQRPTTRDHSRLRPFDLRAPLTQTDTANRFLRSAGAATFSQLWRVGVAFLTQLVLRRYIPKEDWGLADWVLVVFLVLGAIRDLGLPVHTIRVKERPFGNLLAWELGWGATLSVLVVLAAPLFLFALKDPHPDTVPVIQAMALFLFLEGLAQVPLVYFESELRVGRAVVPELLRNACYALTAIALALNGYGVWSIVVAQVVASALFATTLWARARGQIPLTWLRGQTPRLLRSSVRLAAVWVLILLVRHIDKLILGAKFSVEDLAVYSFAYWVAFLVPEIMVQPVGRAAYPAFIAFADDPARKFGAYRLSTTFLLSLEVPAALFLFVNAEWVVQLIGGSQWVGAPAFLRVLCFAPLIDPFSRFGGELLASHHRDRIWIVATATTMLSFLVAGLLLTDRYGPMGMAYANFLPLGALVMIWGVSSLDRSRFAGLTKALISVYLVPVPLFAVTLLLFEPGSIGRIAARSRPSPSPAPSTGGDSGLTSGSSSGR